MPLRSNHGKVLQALNYAFLPFGSETTSQNFPFTARTDRRFSAKFKFCNLFITAFIIETIIPYKNRFVNCFYGGIFILLAPRLIRRGASNIIFYRCYVYFLKYLFKSPSKALPWRASSRAISCTVS